MLMANNDELLSTGDQFSGSTDSYERSDAFSEGARFNRILRRHIAARGNERSKLREILIAYLHFSPRSSILTNDLITTCIANKHSGHLDVAIDILSAMDHRLLVYANKYLNDDVSAWHHLYSPRAYEPNDDYWYILLRSVARCRTSVEARLAFIVKCKSAADRGVMEGVIEALGDLATPQSCKALARIAEEGDDPFIRNLADEVRKSISG